LWLPIAKIARRERRSKDREGDRTLLHERGERDGGKFAAEVVICNLVTFDQLTGDFLMCFASSKKENRMNQSGTNRRKPAILVVQ
jgi:hypothetical protein